MLKALGAGVAMILFATPAMATVSFSAAGLISNSDYDFNYYSEGKDYDQPGLWNGLQIEVSGFIDNTLAYGENLIPDQISFFQAMPLSGLPDPFDYANALVKNGVFCFSIMDPIHSSFLSITLDRANKIGKFYSEYTQTAIGYKVTLLSEFSITSVTGVPEAPSWAMMLLGFAAVGLAGSRRIRNKAGTVR